MAEPTPGQAAREADAEREQAEWLHWAQANSVDPDCDRGTWTAEWMARAFKGGMQAERDPQQALPVAVAALRTIAWGCTPDGKPIDPSVVADKALAELKRLGYDEERLADAAQEPEPAPVVIEDFGRRLSSSEIQAVTEFGGPPAPELAAAMAVLAKVRAACERPAEAVGHTSGSRVVNGDYLARHLLDIIKRAGLEGLT